mmetsp:Transcript_28332/g.40591  ORF Transcript_28332/g.40591 Transcript_28332/m.40591 type:complete len:370 (-) Transcript_28332:740-1849(-)
MRSGAALQTAVAVVAVCNYATGFISPSAVVCGGRTFQKQWGSYDEIKVPLSKCIKEKVFINTSANGDNICDPDENGAIEQHDSSKESCKPQRLRKVLRTCREKLRKRSRSIALTAVVALAAWRIGASRPVYASASSSNLSPGIELLTKLPFLEKNKEVVPSLSLEDFERLQRKIPPLPELPSSLADNPSITSIPEQSIILRGNQDSFATGKTATDLRNLARSKKVKNSALSSRMNLAAPAAGVAFFLLNLFRSKVRYDREKAYVEDNIEKMEIQRAEYFNVTGKSLSDDDLMQSLAKAAGNITLEENNDDDDEDEKDSKSSSKPKIPPDSNGGKPSTKNSNDGDPSPSSDDSWRASDDDIERMKRMFKK